jgi:hypothetical protein
LPKKREYLVIILLLPILLVLILLVPTLLPFILLIPILRMTSSVDIPYDVAKAKVAELSEETQAPSLDTDSEARLKYDQLDKVSAKYWTSLVLTDQWAEEQAMTDEKREKENELNNREALELLRRHTPVNVRNMTEVKLICDPTPNGNILLKEIMRTNVLQLLRMDPVAMEQVLPSLLEGMRTTGLTLTERQDPSVECKREEMIHAYQTLVEEYG